MNRMNYKRYPRVLLPLLLLALLAVAPIPASAQTKGKVDAAQEAEEQAFAKLRAADEALADALHVLERIQGEIYSLNWRIEKLGLAIVAYQDDVTNLNERAKAVVIDAYTSGGQNLVTSAFSAESIQELITTQALYDAATTRDLGQLDQLDAVSRQMDRLTDELTTKESEVQQLQVEHQVVVESLAVLQEEASKLHDQASVRYAKAYQAYKAELRRQAAAAAAKASGGAKGIPNQTKNVPCPIKGRTYFIDTWGAPRSGGRTHKGTDMIASRGTPLIAMRSGTVRLNSHALGGRQVYVYGDDGITYYYAHLSSWASGLKNGQRVNQRQVIGYVGSSGNATTNVLHLGIIVGGRYVNPYPTVRAAC